MNKKHKIYFISTFISVSFATVSFVFTMGCLFTDNDFDMYKFLIAPILGLIISWIYISKNIKNDSFVIFLFNPVLYYTILATLLILYFDFMR